LKGINKFVRYKGRHFARHSPFPAAKRRGGSPHASAAFKGAPSSICSFTQSYIPSTQSLHILLLSGTNFPDCKRDSQAWSVSRVFEFQYRAAKSVLGSARPQNHKGNDTTKFIWFRGSLRSSYSGSSEACAEVQLRETRL
jgi:hypothetical protein